MNTETYLSSHVLSQPAPSEPESLGELENAAGDTKIELLELPDDGSGLRMQLVDVSWGSGLGWYVRKRLTLDAEQGAGLAALLTGALAPTQQAVQPFRKPSRPVAEQEGNVIRLFPAAEASDTQ